MSAKKSTTPQTSKMSSTAEYVFSNFDNALFKLEEELLESHSGESLDDETLNLFYPYVPIMYSLSSRYNPNNIIEYETFISTPCRKSSGTSKAAQNCKIEISSRNYYSAVLKLKLMQLGDCVSGLLPYQVIEFMDVWITDRRFAIFRFLEICNFELLGISR